MRHIRYIVRNNPDRTEWEHDDSLAGCGVNGADTECKSCGCCIHCQHRCPCTNCGCADLGDLVLAPVIQVIEDNTPHRPTGGTSPTGTTTSSTDQEGTT